MRCTFDPYTKGSSPSHVVSMTRSVCYAYCEIEVSLPVVTCALVICSRLLAMPVVAQLVQKFSAHYVCESFP